MHLIAMAGLPGTGKSTLARALAARLSAHVFDKDVVRAALFGPERIEYSREQDDHVMRTIHAAAGFLNEREAVRFAVLDGRTYARRAQVDALDAFARAARIAWCFVECTCSEAVALERLARDAAHPARNRTPELYRELRASQEPIGVGRVIVDTSSGTTAEHVERCLAHFRERGWDVA